MYNQDVTKYLYETFHDLSFAQTEGRMFADKSYGFDTMFFCSRFVLRFAKEGIYKKSILSEMSNKYIEDIFCIEGKKTGVPNYMNEATSLLNFVGAIKPTEKRGIFCIKNKNLLYIYSI